MAILTRKEIAHKYYLKHKAKILKKKKLYNQKNKTKISSQRQDYYLENKEKFKKLNKEYVLKHQNEIKQYKKEYNKKHKKEKQEYNHEYYKLNKSTINAKRNEYFKKRKKKDFKFKILCNLRVRISEILKYKKKNYSTINLIGCSLNQLKQYLENQFKKGMSWKNYGKWHIDHIRPCASFNLSKVSEQQKCFNYTNLQPLWAIDNYRKNKKLQRS